MSELASSVILWGITVLLGGTMLFFVKRFIEKTSDRQEEHNKQIGDIATDIKVLVQQVVDFKEHCAESEEVTLNRLNAHSEDLKQHGQLLAVHKTRIDDHERRIEKVEKKVG